MSPSKKKSAGPGPEQLKHNQTVANFAFLPFVVQLLSDKLPSKGVQPLPLGDPESLTLEAVEAVQDIANQAVLAHLSHSSGWSKQLFLQRGEDRPVEGRMWDPRIWRSLELSFSDSSLESLLIAYNLTRKVPKASELKAPTSSDSKPLGAVARNPFAARGDISIALAKKRNLTVNDIEKAIQSCTKQSLKALKQLPLEQNGDLLLHHRVFSKLVPLVELDQSTTQAYLRNPLNLMTHFHLCSELKATHLDSLEGLLAPHLGPLLPWLSKQWARRWVDIEARRWAGPRGQDPLDWFKRFNHNQSLLFAAWYALAEQKERPDILVCLIEYYRDLFQKCGPSSQWLQKFRLMSQDLRHMERNEYIEGWVRSMLPALTLRRAYEDARELHPIDREPAHHLYMDVYQKTGFEQILTLLEDFLETLQPKIG